jgi:crotonobetainyl-CoA:carnitine CoA-transferase CaiB-like acyl-CoA transferase
LQALFDHHEVGWSPIQSIADVFADPHFQARESIVSVEDTELGPVKMQNVVPRFSETAGRVATAGPALGQHNNEIYRDLLGLSDDELKRLKTAEVI